jgi:hypothetical protein
MDGCLVAYRPTRFDANQPGISPNAPLADRVTADIYILETPGGQRLQIGGSEGNATNPARPHSHTVAAPAKFDGVWINSQEIVRACAPNGQLVTTGLVLGRIERGTQGNRPWRLIAVSNTPDEARAIAVWTAIMAGQAAWNEPVPLHAPPAAPVVYYTPPAPAATPDPQAQFQAWLAAQQPAAPAMPPAPAGWTQAAWEGLQPAQRDQVMAFLAGPRPGQPSGL